ncbi:MAG TPA: succinylglutamate desuccinylase/aspartoacylase family protein [Pseudomonadales bacterium]|nr:succinylglutamate desuccinylase/aspartoacylase family protein [Pseudomonadales bacterium]
MKLTELDALPEGLLDLPAHRLHERLEGPTLIHLRGAREPALFVSVLLHGNEHGGWDALRALLAARPAGTTLPRSLSILIGNVEAARFRLRHLDHQPDFNRIWRGASGPEADVAADVLARMTRRGLLLAVDVHNNTGVNPHYACVTRHDATSIALGARFARPVILVNKPDTVLAAALAHLAPAVILEAGRPGEQRGVEHVGRYLADLLELETLPHAPESPVDLYRTVASVKLAPDVHFGFTAPGVERDARDLHLLHEFEHFNFETLEAGTLFGHVPVGAPLPLRVTDDFDRDVAADWFRREGDELRFAREVVPAMFSPDVRILRQDVVCYLMERIG